LLSVSGGKGQGKKTARTRTSGEKAKGSLAEKILGGKERKKKKHLDGITHKEPEGGGGQ